MRARGTAVVVVALAALVVAPPLARAEPSQSQEFFREKLLQDGRTSREVKDLLRRAPGEAGSEGGGFVDRRITFKDLTGDDKADAVVRVQSGGAAGIVAVYVFSTAGADELRAVFRSQSLTRASTRVREGRLSYRYARFAPGDELCCPSRIDESRLRWRPRKERFVVVKRVQVEPEPEPAPAAR